MASPRDHYKILGIPHTATEAEIKQAFRRLAREYHPDLNPNNTEAEQAFKLIREAYDVLSDRAQRQRYDLLCQSGNGGASTSELADYRHYYSKAIALASQQRFNQADSHFSEAINLRPDFLEAYMGRCQVRYAIGNDQGVLDDCTQIILLDPAIPQAYYYQGRAHQRLHLSELAIQAYSQAIALDQTYASAYYYRGLAKSKLQDNPQAITDLKTASQLFRAAGNTKAKNQSEFHLNRLRKIAKPRPLGIVGDIFITAAQSAFNPGQFLVENFMSLSRQRAIAVGLAYGIIAILGGALGLILFWESIFSLSLLPLSLLLVLPWSGLLLSIALAGMILGNRGNWAGDIFVAGATGLPIGIGMLASGPARHFGPYALVALYLFIITNSIITLYVGLTQIIDIPEEKASLMVPLMLFLGIGITHGAYQLLLSTV
jgi:curved DNA-binding protein CbpA